ncbi:MAG TPA: cupin domain-containing protein [Polyangia bacterium]
MLSKWLSPMTLAQFQEQHFRRLPHAAAGTASNVGALLDWDALGRILGVATPNDVLTVARGKVIEAPPPRSLADVKHLFSSGLGLTVRKVAKYQPGLAALAEAFAAELPGTIDLHVFVTPGGTHGYGWHYDIEHVFIVQTAGRKDYYFRRNTRVDHLPPDAQPDLAQYPNETSPIATATLLPGDWLYLPARWWHVALCAEDSLSLSLGIVPAAQ